MTLERISGIALGSGAMLAVVQTLQKIPEPLWLFVGICVAILGAVGLHEAEDVRRAVRRQPRLHIEAGDTLGTVKLTVRDDGAAVLEANLKHDNGMVSIDMAAALAERTYQMGRLAA